MKLKRGLFLTCIIMSQQLCAAGESNHRNTLVTRRNVVIAVGALALTSLGVYSAFRIYRSFVPVSPINLDKVSDLKIDPKNEERKDENQGEKASLEKGEPRGYVMYPDQRTLFKDTNMAPSISLDGRSLMLQQYEGSAWSDDYKIENRLSVDKSIAVFQIPEKGSHFFGNPYEGGASQAVRYLQKELRDQPEVRRKISQIIIITDEHITAWNAQEWGEPEGFAKDVTIHINPANRMKSKDLFWDNPVRNIGDNQVLIFISPKK